MMRSWRCHEWFADVIIQSNGNYVARFQIRREAEQFMTVLNHLKEITPDDIRKVRGCRLNALADRLEEILKCLR